MKLFALLCVLGACATTDDRPETFAYINETILAPSCGTTLCHSAMKKAGGYAFDSLANTQTAFTLSHANPVAQLIITCDQLGQISPCGTSIQKSYLMIVMTTGDNAKGNRMPLDQALPSRDLALIADWIDNGAEGATP